MKRSLLDILVDPISGTALEIEAVETGDEESIAEGTLRGSEGRTYPIVRGIPRFVSSGDRDQKQTEGSFGFAWQRRATYDSPKVRAELGDWIVRRDGFADLEEMKAYFGSRRRILDAGCGSGFSSSLWLDALSGDWVGLDISEGVDAAQERLGGIAGTHFVQGDVMQPPFRAETFDTIVSEGVLHHTPSTERALKSVAALLEPGGEFFFYVYRKKSPIREFTDDYVREIVSRLPEEDAWQALRPLTRLGQALAELATEIEVPEDIPYLGIQAGRYDIQRLIYWHVGRLFWNEEFSFEENNHMNFEWYHPRYSHRQTEEEVRGWCGEADLSIVHFDEQPGGFAVRAVRRP